MNKEKLDLSVFCFRARTFVSQGRLEDAIGLYDDVLHVDPENELAYADRGTVYAMVKDFESALSDLNRAFELGYADASAYCTAATVYLEKNELQKALEYFDKAIAADQNHALAYYNRSSVFQRLGERQAAYSDLERCLSLGPDDDFRRLIENRRRSLTG